MIVANPERMSIQDYLAAIPKSDGTVKEITVHRRFLFLTKTIHLSEYHYVDEISFPGYFGSRLYVRKYKTTSFTEPIGYRIYLHTGDMITDSNGVIDLKKTLEIALMRLKGLSQAVFPLSINEHLHKAAINQSLLEGTLKAEESIALGHFETYQN